MKCCILVVSFLPTSLGATSAQNALMSQYATSSQVCLPTHMNTLCAVPVYMYPASITVSLKSGGKRCVKHIEATDCSLQKW